MPRKHLRQASFKPIWDVLEALKSHDDRLSDELDQLRIELGAKRKRSVGASDLTKIVFDLPTSVNEDFAQSLRAHLVEQTTESWMFWYGLLESFRQRTWALPSDCYSTRPTTVIGLVFGSQTRDKLRMQWNLIVGSD